MPAKVLASTEDMPYAGWLEYRKIYDDGPASLPVQGCRAIFMFKKEKLL